MTEEHRSYLRCICILLATIIAAQIVSLTVFCCEVMEIREHVKMISNRQLRSGR